MSPTAPRKRGVWMNDEVGPRAERLRARWVPERKLRYYRALGLEPGVSLEELKQTHKGLVLSNNDDGRRRDAVGANGGSPGERASDQPAGEYLPPSGPAFGLGSTKDEVLAIQGTPTSVDGSRWMYELSSIDFSDGKVESYANISRNLHVRLRPAGDSSAARSRGYFTLGSSPDEVLGVQGTPTSIEGNRWTYELSWIKFDMGKVESYSNFSGNLRLRVR